MLDGRYRCSATLRSWPNVGDPVLFRFESSPGGKGGGRRPRSGKRCAEIITGKVTFSRSSVGGREEFLRSSLSESQQT